MLRARWVSRRHAFCVIGPGGARTATRTVDQHLTGDGEPTEPARLANSATARSGWA
jgi:hypothetical protein